MQKSCLKILDHTDTNDWYVIRSLRQTVEKIPTSQRQLQKKFSPENGLNRREKQAGCRVGWVAFPSEILQRQSFSGYLGEGPETLQRRPRGQATVIYWLLVKKLTPDRASKRAVSWGKGGLITATYPHLSLSQPDAWWVMQTDAHMLKVTHMQVCM